LDLLNRYLGAVAAQLPERQRESITLELREELLSRMEERREELRRPLTQQEVSAVLKSCGHPLVVAAAYLPQRQLLSPALLPFYWFATRVIIGTDLLGYMAYAVAALLFGDSPGHVLATFGDSLWIVTMYHIGVITFSALILDRLSLGRLLAKAWSPRWLPGPARPSQAVLALDMTGLLVVLLIEGGAARGLLPTGAAEIRAGPVWEEIGPVVVVAAAAQLGIHLLQRLLPAPERGVRLAKLILGALLLAVAAVAARTRPWIEVAGMPPEAGQAVSRALDTGIAIALGAVMVMATVMIARNGLRLIGALRRAP
jgi:hypothetical protein